MMTDDLTTGVPATAVPESPLRRETVEQAVARLRAAHHEFVSAPVVSESLLMARNVAVVQALEAGVPGSLVQEITRMGPAALELAVARGTYHRDHAPRRHGPAVGEHR